MPTASAHYRSIQGFVHWHLMFKLLVWYTKKAKSGLGIPLCPLIVSSKFATAPHPTYLLTYLLIHSSEGRSICSYSEQPLDDKS